MRIVLMIMLILNLASAKKVALVIGNSNYNQGYLANPTKDADLIAQKLREVGFTVTPKNNIETVEDMKDVINDFAKTVNEEDIAVVYYAGHGVQCKGTNYLIPTKAKIAKGGQLKSEALKLDFLIGGMSNIKLAILMIDACRDNTYPSCTKSQTRGLIQPHTPEEGGMIISFATAEGKTADDGDKHSPYALALSKFITKKIPIETFFRKVGGEVFASSSQRPMLKNSFYGRFSFGGSNKNENKYNYIEVNSQSEYDNLGLQMEANFVEIKNTNPTDRPQEVVVSNVTTKWIIPPKNICIANGGIISKYGRCVASWENSTKICSASGGKLPIKEDFHKVIRDCGGRVATHGAENWRIVASENEVNKSYQSCFRERGFSKFGYWIGEIKNSSQAWYVDLEYGNDVWFEMVSELGTLCIR